jgi:hypothetical protein
MRQQGMIAAAEKRGEKRGEERGEKRGEKKTLSIFSELGISPDIIKQAEAKLDTNDQN